MLLVDEFIQKMSSASKSVLAKTDDPLVKSGMPALYQAVRTGEKVYFAPSTMSMLTDKLAHFDEIANELLSVLGTRDIEEIYQRSSRFESGWIEFDKPISLTVPIAAIFCFQPAKYLSTGMDGYQLYLIDQFADVSDILVKKTSQETWTFARQYHRCPKCKYEYGVLVPCGLCQYALDVWSKIFGLSFIIAGQYLAALRYEEKTFTGMRREKRQHSNKERRVPVKHIFKVIDANEIIVQVPPQEKSEQAREIRGSWIVEGEVSYEEIQTRPFTRTYRHERYKASGLQGTTVKFPEGIKRMQPRRKDNIGKHVTKVKASLYE